MRRRVKVIKPVGRSPLPWRARARLAALDAKFRAWAASRLWDFGDSLIVPPGADR